KPGLDLNHVRYSDLNYTDRLSALLKCTRDAGVYVERDVFNDWLYGRRNILYVQRAISAIHGQI
ncbi:hypothetical protein ACYT69_11825, partial [Streptococcus pyogenes]